MLNDEGVPPLPDDLRARLEALPIHGSLRNLHLNYLGAYPSLSKAEVVDRLVARVQEMYAMGRHREIISFWAQLDAEQDERARRREALASKKMIVLMG